MKKSLKPLNQAIFRLFYAVFFTCLLFIQTFGYFKISWVKQPILWRLSWKSITWRLNSPEGKEDIKGWQRLRILRAWVQSPWTKLWIYLWRKEMDILILCFFKRIIREEFWTWNPLKNLEALRIVFISGYKKRKL